MNKKLIVFSIVSIAVIYFFVAWVFVLLIKDADNLLRLQERVEFLEVKVRELEAGK